MTPQEQHFFDHGWVRLPLLQPEVVFKVREALVSELRNQTGNKKATLEDYHTIVSTDEEHIALQAHLTEFFRAKRFGQEIIKAQILFLKNFFGLDLNVQKNPYLRIARPGKRQDNIGYHRDTFYGGHPSEISILVPFVDLPKESSLSFLSGSHTAPEKDFPTTETVNPDPATTKGSLKHQLGFLYAPKLIDPVYTKNMHAIPLALGEALIFSSATVHGSEENRGIHTRFSSDTRVINARTLLENPSRRDYYESLCC